MVSSVESKFIMLCVGQRERKKKVSPTSSWYIIFSIKISHIRSIWIEKYKAIINILNIIINVLKNQSYNLKKSNYMIDLIVQMNSNKSLFFIYICI